MLLTAAEPAGAEAGGVCLARDERMMFELCGCKNIGMYIFSKGFQVDKFVFKCTFIKDETSNEPELDIWQLANVRV